MGIFDPTKDQMSPEEMAMMANQRQAAAQAQANLLIQFGAASCYGAMVAAEHAKLEPGESVPDEDLRRIAQKAMEYGPFIAESHGLIKIERKQPQQRIHSNRQSVQGDDS
jgi:hypothetical protein